jgi:hypothetical protein
VQNLRRRPPGNGQCIADFASQAIEERSGDAVHHRIRQHEGKDDAAVSGGRNVEALEHDRSENRQGLPVEIVDDGGYKSEGQHQPAGWARH